MTKTRTTRRGRRYQFTSREAAESAYTDKCAEHHQQLRLARALYDGSIRWLFRRKPYRLGIFDEQSHSGPWFVIVFEPGNGQQPDLTVINLLDRAKAETYRPQLPYNRGYTAEENALVDMLQQMEFARGEYLRNERNGAQ